MILITLSVTRLVVYINLISSAAVILQSRDSEAARMGSSASTGGADPGVGALVREIGLAIIPLHLKHSYESIVQIVGEKTQ
jgi:hypothetical protein